MHPPCPCTYTSSLDATPAVHADLLPSVPVHCPQLRLQLLAEYGIDPITEQVGGSRGFEATQNPRQQLLLGPGQQQQQHSCPA